MKYLLIDYSNEGILFVGGSPVVVNQLKIGLVDTKIKVLDTKSPDYNTLNLRDVLNGQKHYWVSTLGKINELETGAINPAYSRRRELVALRYPLIDRVINYTFMISQKTKITIWDGFENNLKDILDGSPAGEFMLTEYAHINCITVGDAIKEIKLLYESISCFKMRIYAQQKYFIDKINNIDSATQVQPLLDEIVDKFYRDTQI